MVSQGNTTISSVHPSTRAGDIYCTCSICYVWSTCRIGGNILTCRIGYMIFTCRVDGILSTCRNCKKPMYTCRIRYVTCCTGRTGCVSRVLTMYRADGGQMSAHCDGAALEAYVFFRCGGCGFEHHHWRGVLAHQNIHPNAQHARHKRRYGTGL